MKSGEQHTPSRNQTSIRNGFQKEITVTPGILGQTSACALRPWQCLPGPVFPPVTLIKQGLGTRLSFDGRYTYHVDETRDRCLKMYTSGAVYYAKSCSKDPYSGSVEKHEHQTIMKACPEGINRCRYFCFFLYHTHTRPLHIHVHTSIKRQR